MHPLIRFAAALVFLFLAALSVLACPKSPKPIHPVFQISGKTQSIIDLLPDSGKTWSQDLNSGPQKVKSSGTDGRICSCQVLNLQSSNYDHRYVVLLAERTDAANSAGFRATKSRIEKEKRQLKKLFYDKIKTVAELQGSGSCKTMYFRLRAVDEQLQLYEILDAD